MKLPLRYYGHPDLRAKASPIQVITPEIIQLAQDMIETMIESNGVGLAAPQIGRRLRLFIRRFEGLNAKGEYYLGEPEVILNPVLSSPSPETEAMVEGCLSIPGIHVNVVRPKRISLRYQNLKGEWIEEVAEGFVARVTMHENDHLNGVLHVDRASPLERARFDAQLRAIKKKHS